MYNPEDQFIRSKTLSEKPLTTDENKVKEMLYSKSSVRDDNMARKKMEDIDAFLEIYSGDKESIIKMIERDKKEVQNLRDDPKNKEKTERADLLEKILEEQCESAEWLGNNAYMTQMTEFDDRLNHTDLIIEWEKEDGSMPKLAVDCTVSEDPEVLEKKYSYSIAGIRDRHLTKIKYFQSSKNPDELGPIDMVPRVVLNVRKEKLDGLCRAIIQKEVQKHYMQYYLLLNIQRQMQYQLSYIGRDSQRNTEIPDLSNRKRHQSVIDQMKSKVVEILDIVEKIMEDKKSSLGPEAVKRAEEDFIASNPTQYLEQAQAR